MPDKPEQNRPGSMQTWPEARPASMRARSLPGAPCAT